MSTSVLLTHLRNPSPPVPLDTLNAALAHHLAVNQTSPTPLAAAAVSSPFFLAYPHTHQRLQGLVTAFRHAVYLKHQALVKNREDGWSLSKALFSKGTHAALREWVRDVLRGLQGGLAIVKLACCVGLLLGLRQLGDTFQISQVENEVVISLAEVLDNYTSSTTEWEKDFWPDLDETTLSLTLILAAQSLPHVNQTKLNALPLALLVRLLSTTISSAFEKGELLNSLPKSAHEGPIHIDPSSSFAKKIIRITSTPTMRSIASLSKLTSVLLGVLIDSTGGLVEIQKIFDAFRNMASKIERDWVASQLSTAENEDAIAPDTKGLSKTIWTLLKTFFFSTIMIAEGALDSVVYTEPQHPEPQSSSPHTLAESTIHALAHLSFVISQFGGVTAMGTSDEPGFTELRKVFYLAVDVLCSEEDAVPTEVQENRCEAFTRELVQQLTVFEGRKNITQSLKNAKAAYTLACIEQLIPLLRDPCLKEYVWSVCVPYLSDPTDRATYESAHSVILSIFASHARQHPNHTHLAPNHGATSFVHQIVPFYAQCLIENSKEGSLSTSQLRLAYAALVRGASSNGGDNLAWYCITLIIDTIRSLSSTLAGAGAKDEKQRTQLHRLHLTLISTIPSLPLPLMLLALDEILVVLKDLHATEEDGAGEKGRGKELVEALFKELLEGVGDREKEAAMRWWYDHREELELGSPVAATREGEKLVEARL